MWGATGLNGANLYPIDQLSSDTIVIVGGEWDALATIQHGIPAITRTAAEMVWRGSWTPLFEGKTVYLCHDMDDTGQAANRKVERLLSKVAITRAIKLPFRVVKKAGKDISDYWMKHDAEDFRQLLEKHQPPPDPEVKVISVQDSFDSRRVGLPVRMQLTIKGKKEPGYSIPEIANLSCTQDAGPKCEFCPLNA
jgi:DNA primase